MLAVNYGPPEVIQSLFHATVGLCRAAMPSLLLAWRRATPSQTTMQSITVYRQFLPPAQNLLVFTLGLVYQAH